MGVQLVRNMLENPAVVSKKKSAQKVTVSEMQRLYFSGINSRVLIFEIKFFFLNMQSKQLVESRSHVEKEILSKSQYLWCQVLNV